ncbi:hypothetical protein QJS10_CPB20g01351 [Acorus calamus]|uniref:Myb/SANT-like DNA-binding domain-containing protein n=1 Tax=Acorus calamus TaxID=4465 RepID=A0AAV9CAN3_ACOCL|nr:hypothetical protein QJS10_CPB20g01351 [Acorus calamus]
MERAMRRWIAQYIERIDEETISLIENYGAKWQSLDRGDLSVADWQSVADSIAWQCEQDPPLKTATQCMNKVEELLKRYWKERFKTSSSWPYFWFLDAMEIDPPDNVRSMRFRPG